MTREEQIIEYANSFTGKGVENDELKEIIRLAIIDGAKWADANPSQPSLPSNLDEAAEISANGAVISRQSSMDGRVFYNLKERCFNHADLMKQYKAGSEWMAGQGVTIEGEVVSTDKNRTSIRYATPCYPTYHDYIYIKPIGRKKGDKVEVQIRNK